MELNEYWDKLNCHDWYYQFSDDHRIWRNGETVNKQLAAIANQSPEHMALWDGFSKWAFSGPAWDTEKAPKPEKPGAKDGE